MQGIAFDRYGRAFSVEHGSYRDDEVNLLQAGANYGWDPVPAAGGSGYDESWPMTDLDRHPGAVAAVWSSGPTTIAPSGGTFLAGAAWSGWNGALALAVLKDHQLRVIGLKGDTTTLEQQWAALADSPRLRVAVQGPDGDLYLATDQDPGVILRVTPSQAPDA